MNRSIAQRVSELARLSAKRRAEEEQEKERARRKMLHDQWQKEVAERRERRQWLVINAGYVFAALLFIAAWWVRR